MRGFLPDFLSALIRFSKILIFEPVPAHVYYSAAAAEKF
jgi:hypothetical protein